MKNGYEQIVENKQTRADTHLNGISLYQFAVMGIRRGENTVKQPGPGGTFLHIVPGITGFLGGKTPFPCPVFM